MELLTRRGRSRERKNSSPDDRANADASESEWTESAFHLPLGRGRFGYQMVRAFLPKKLRCHWPQIVSLADWSGNHNFPDARRVEIGRGGSPNRPRAIGINRPYLAQL